MCVLHAVDIVVLWLISWRIPLVPRSRGGVAGVKAACVGVAWDDGYSVRNGHVEVVQSLLPLYTKDDVNIRSARGETALLAAVRAESIEVSGRCRCSRRCFSV